MSEPAGLELRDAIASAAGYAGLPLPARPRLAPWLAAVDLGDGRVQLRSDETAHTLAHPLLARVFCTISPLLDGRHTVDEIVAAAEDVLPTTVIFVLKLLQGRGLLQPGDGECDAAGDEALARFVAQFGDGARGVLPRLATATIALEGSADLRTRIAASLATIGVSRIVETADREARRADLLVACAGSSAPAFFEDVNARSLASGTRWMRVALAGTSAHLGPTVIPHETACYACFERRRMTHEPDLDAFAAYRARRAPASPDASDGSLAPLAATLAAQSAMEVMRLLTAFAPAVTIGRYWEWNAASPSATAHEVLRVPRCPGCSRRRSFPHAWDETPPSPGVCPP